MPYDHYHARVRAQRKQAVLKRYGHQCAWCSRGLSNKQLTVDHVLCVCAGGSDWIGNLLPACSRCNHKRGNTSAVDFLRSCLDRRQKVRLQLCEQAIERALYNPLCDREQHDLHCRRKQVLRQLRLAAHELMPGLDELEEIWNRPAHTRSAEPVAIS